MWELSTETNRIETVVVRYEVATILATVEKDAGLDVSQRFCSVG